MQIGVVAAAADTRVLYGRSQEHSQDKKRINKSASSRERVSNASDLLIYLFICQQAVAVAAAPAVEERGGRDLSKAVRSLPTCTFAIGALSLDGRPDCRSVEAPRARETQQTHGCGQSREKNTHSRNVKLFSVGKGKLIASACVCTIFVRQYSLIQ